MFLAKEKVAIISGQMEMILEISFWYHPDIVECEILGLPAACPYIDRVLIPHGIDAPRCMTYAENKF